MTSQLMPAYFTTTRTSRKSKKRKKTASLLKAEADHAKWRKKFMGGSGERPDKVGQSYRQSVQSEEKGSISFTSNYPSVAQPGSASALGAEGREFKSLHSDQFYDPSMAKKADKIYTGDEIIGIATMHKSNAVPIRGKKQAEEVARMRRG